MTPAGIAIAGEPITDAMCRFTVDRPVNADKYVTDPAAGRNPYYASSR